MSILLVSKCFIMLLCMISMCSSILHEMDVNDTGRSGLFAEICRIGASWLAAALI